MHPAAISHTISCICSTGRPRGAEENTVLIDSRRCRLPVAGRSAVRPAGICIQWLQDGKKRGKQHAAGGAAARPDGRIESSH